MLRIQFNNKKTMQTADFAMVSDSVVQLTGEKITANTSGFKTYRLNGDFLGDYSEYTKIIDEKPGCVQFGK